MRSVLLLLGLLATPVACGQPTAPGTGLLRVLFIGNSLTAFNNLPGVVEALGALGPRPVETGAALLPGASLEDHWNAGSRAALNDGPWDVVVLQQGPSSLTASAAHLLDWSLTWNDPIRQVGAVPALYAVWPEAARMEVFPDVSSHYRAAADAVNGIFLPAGDAWLAAWAEDADLPLYGPDQFHPSQLGTLLAALVIYGGLTGTVPDLPGRLEGDFLVMSIPAGTGALLVRAARAALASR